MKRGPAPKPAERKQGRSLPAVVPLRRGESPSFVPCAPAGLSAATRGWWDRFWASPLAGVVPPEALPALERLAFYYDEHGRLQRAIRNQGRFTTGSTGQVVANPAYKSLLAIEQAITRLEGELGLTPMARVKLMGDGARAQKSLDDLNREVDEVDDADDPRATLDVASEDG